MMKKQAPVRSMVPGAALERARRMIDEGRMYCLRHLSRHFGEKVGDSVFGLMDIHNAFHDSKAKVMHNGNPHFRKESNAYTYRLEGASGGIPVRVIFYFSNETGDLWLVCLTAFFDVPEDKKHR